jgi:HSP20 family protein
MSLIPWKIRQHDAPAREQSLSRGFQNEMDRLFDSFFHDVSWPISQWTAGGWSPAVDLQETDKELLVRAEIPGVTADDLEVSISGNTLVISGEKKESQEKREKGFIYQERHFGSFRRQVPLPVPVDPSGVRAEYKDGVLHLTLKKSTEALPKKIPIRSAN